jgi:GTP-binding protein
MQADVTVVKAEFMKGAHSLKQLPAQNLPEIAILGRSNVGKSTLINTICSKKGLARTSNTPGRTQEMNVFHLVTRMPQGKEKQIRLVDFPGFGYAKFSQQKRVAVSKYIVEYLRDRSRVEGVLLLVDSRRGAEADELAIRDICEEEGKALIIILTKCDKLSKNELRSAKQNALDAFGVDEEALLLSPSKTLLRDVLERLA